MPGFLTNGLPLWGQFTGVEQLPVDTMLVEGENPASVAVTSLQLALALKLLANSTDRVTVAGSRYYTSVAIGAPTEATGVQVLIGSVGGTDKLIVEVHDAEGNLLATSALAGVTAGAANTVQAIPFTAPVALAPGTYFLAVQSNGTTAHLASYDAPALPLLVGSAAGTFGTSAAIVPPTSYTAGVGPMAQLY